MAYYFLSILLWPILFIYTLKIALRDKSSRYFFQRLGFAYPQQDSKTIWIHCASVGEVNTYRALHLQLLKRLPQQQFIITTNTTTGASIVAQHKFDRTQHCYLPIESNFAIKSFLRACQPTQCLIMETEIWPLLYRRCSLNNISITIINARLSRRTLNTFNWVKKTYRTSLTQVSKILCKSMDELNNFKQLGANDKQLLVAGNLKFAHTQTNKSLTAMPLNNRKYCLAASTHHDEEFQLAKSWLKLKSKRLLVIVPRHPNRSQSIQKQLAPLNINLAVRSQQQAVTEDTQVYLADTLGELTQFMLGAEWVFIGGTLIEHGGQNILEPCRLGKPTLCGPHMFNFKEELEFLRQHNACLQINNITELETFISDFDKNPAAFASLGKNARRVLNQQSNILETYISQLQIQT